MGFPKYARSVLPQLSALGVAPHDLCVLQLDDPFSALDHHGLHGHAAFQDQLIGLVLPKRHVDVSGEGLEKFLILYHLVPANLTILKGADVLLARYAL